MSQEEEYKQVDQFIVTTKQLGQGAFGTVFRGFFKDNHDKIVAVKVIPLERVSNDPQHIKLLKRQIQILQQINSNYIVKLYHATRTSRNLYMFLEYCGDGDLKELLKKRGGQLTETEAVLYFRQICQGFQVLYQNQIIHRDIKPANILLHEGKAAISDFGFARCLDSTGMEEQVQLSYLGTPLYMSPQILQEDQFSSRCDIWSLGMVFYEMLYGQTPWTGKTPTQLLTNIKQQNLNFPETPQRSDLVKDMLMKMLIMEDEKRISWPELFEHPIIKFDQEAIQKEITAIEQNSSEDALLKSAAVNELYTEQNQVIGFDQTMNIEAFREKAKVSDGTAPSSGSTTEEVKSVSDGNTFQSNAKSTTKDGGSVDYDAVIHKQDKIEERRKIVVLVDSFVTYQRNVGIFVNLTTNLIFRLYKEGVIRINETIFYRMIFLLQKNQLIGFQDLIEIMSNKKPIQEFSKEEWQIYTQSQEYLSTFQLIQTDIGFIKPYFQEIYGRTMHFLKEQTDPNVKQFFTILNQDLSKDNADFIQIHKETLVEFLEAVTNDIHDQSIQQRREFLQVIHYIHICQDPFQEFYWKPGDNADFHEFYDRFDNFSEKDLYQLVLQNLGLSPPAV